MKQTKQTYFKKALAVLASALLLVGMMTPLGAFAQEPPSTSTPAQSTPPSSQGESISLVPKLT